MRVRLRRPRCGDIEGDPYEGLTAECSRRKNHRGDHRCKLTWPKRVYVPSPSGEPRQSMYIPEIWGKTLLDQLMRTTIVRPVEGDTITFTNRDKEL